MPRGSKKREKTYDLGSIPVKVKKPKAKKVVDLGSTPTITARKPRVVDLGEVKVSVRKPRRKKRRIAAQLEDTSNKYTRRTKSGRMSDEDVKHASKVGMGIRDMKRTARRKKAFGKRMDMVMKAYDRASAKRQGRRR